MLSSYASGVKNQRHDRFGMDAPRSQSDNPMNSSLEKKVIDLTQLIKGTQCLVDEIQQSHSRGLGLLKCRIDRLEVSHRSFVENWENSMRKIVTEHFKSHETQYRYLESRVMTGLTKGLKEFQSARSSMENSRACFQGSQLEELEERLSEFEDNVVDSINRISHQSGHYLLDADTIKRKLQNMETTVAKISAHGETPLAQDQDIPPATRLRDRQLWPQRDHPRRYKVQVAAPQTEQGSCMDMDLIIARMPKKCVQEQSVTSGAVNETLQEKVGLRFEKSFLSVQEKLTGMHGTFDDVKETLGCMKDTFPPTQEGKSCKDNQLQRGHSSCMMSRDQNSLEVDATTHRPKVHEMMSSIRVDESDIDQTLGSGAGQTHRDNSQKKMKRWMDENIPGWSEISEVQSHSHRELLQVGICQRDADGDRHWLDGRVERHLLAQWNGESSSQTVRNERADHRSITGNLVLPTHSARALISETGDVPIKESRKGTLHGFNNKGRSSLPEQDVDQPIPQWRHGGKLLKLYSELRELEKQTS